MTTWEKFEKAVLEPLDHAGIKEIHVADVPRPRARQALSRQIQLYLSAQRRSESQTKYVLKRQGRTSASVWTIGERVNDARLITAQFGDDIRTTARRAVLRDVARIAELTPQARTRINEAITPMIDGLVTVVEAMVASALGYDGQNA